MPYPVLPDNPIKDQQDKIDATKKSLRGDDHGVVTSWTDKLIMLVATFLYFRYVGKAIATGQKVPREWLNLNVAQTVDKIKVKFINYFATNLSKSDSKPGETVMGPGENGAGTKKSRYKVIDIASGTPLTVQ